MDDAAPTPLIAPHWNVAPSPTSIVASVPFCSFIAPSTENVPPESVIRDGPYAPSVTGLPPQVNAEQTTSPPVWVQVVVGGQFVSPGDDWNESVPVSMRPPAMFTRACATCRCKGS